MEFRPARILTVRRERPHSFCADNQFRNSPPTTNHLMRRREPKRLVQGKFKGVSYKHHEHWRDCKYRIPPCGWTGHIGALMQSPQYSGAVASNSEYPRKLAPGTRKGFVVFCSHLYEIFSRVEVVEIMLSGIGTTTILR